MIVKLSGEALSGPEKFGIHQPTIDRFAADLVAAHKLGIGLGVVVGGGNVLRGAQISEDGLSRPTADAMGMLATVMNALVLEAAIERAGASARTMSALAMPQVCETYERQRALRHLEDDRIIVFAGGTGNPYFTTDTTAVLRAAEMGCDAVFKATDVDGVYTADPEARSEGQALRAPRPSGSARPQPENHGCDGLRACPGEPYAYHRFFDPADTARSQTVCARKGSFHDCRLRICSNRTKATVGTAEGAMATTTFDMNDLKRRMQGAIASLKQELAGLRTGRASTGLLEHIQVEAYGSHMPLNQLATISVPEPRLLHCSGLGSIDDPRGREGDFRRQSRLDPIERGTGPQAASP